MEKYIENKLDIALATRATLGAVKEFTFKKRKLGHMTENAHKILSDEGLSDSIVAVDFNGIKVICTEDEMIIFNLKQTKQSKNFDYWFKQIGGIENFGVFKRTPLSKDIYFNIETGVMYDKNINYKITDNPLYDYLIVQEKYGISEIKSTTDNKNLAENRRYLFLIDERIREEIKVKVLEMGEFIKHENFWLNNIQLDNKLLVAEDIIREYMSLYNLREKHYDTLSRTCYVKDKESARNEILNQIYKNTFLIKEVYFPNFDPYLIINGYFT